MANGFSYKNKLFVLDETNLYIILGVDENSDSDTISREYRILAKTLHPDLHNDLPPQEAEKLNIIFSKITAAFNTLKDPASRKTYDLEMKLTRAKHELQNRNEYTAEPFKKTEIKREAQKPPPEIKKEVPKSPPETKKEPPKQQSKPEPKKRGNIQDSSPIKNDPRLNDTLSGFSFKSMNFDIDMEQIRKEREKKNKEQSTENFEKAKSLINEKKYDEAINILRFLTEKFSNIAVYHSYLGLAMEGKGWNGYAQAEFKVALHYDPIEPVAIKHYKPSQPETPKIHHEDKEKEQNKGIFDKFKSFFNKS